LPFVDTGDRLNERIGPERHADQPGPGWRSALPTFAWAFCAKYAT